MQRLVLGMASVLLGSVLILPSQAATPASSCSSPYPNGVATTCSGVGPGTFVTVDGGGGCTLNFVFLGSDRDKYIGLAGHCAIAVGSGQRVWKRGVGPAVRLSSGAASIGHVVYAIQQKDDIDDRDFALVRLNSNITPYTSVPFFGGPRGINTRTTTTQEVLSLFGRPPGLGDTAPARQMVARDLANKDHAFANGVSAPGDSGAPVLDSEERAVGILLGAGGNQVTAGTTTGVSDSHGGGLIRILRLAPAIAAAGTALNLNFRLTPGK